MCKVFQLEGQGKLDRGLVVSKDSYSYSSAKGREGDYEDMPADPIVHAEGLSHNTLAHAKLLVGSPHKRPISS